jgi:glycosyltransferase 2 family protein
MNRGRLLQTVLLVAGLAAIIVVTVHTAHDASQQVLPSATALSVAGGLAVVAIVSSARAWAVLFSDLLTTRSSHLVLRGTFYVAQLAKYLPVGGAVQAAGQLGLAPVAGVPVRRAAVAFPVTVIGAVAASATIGSGLVFSGALPTWVRLLVLLGLLTPLLLHRSLMAAAIDAARHVVRRLPKADELPSQRSIIYFYLWALVTIGSLCGIQAVLVHSLEPSANPGIVFCAFAIAWVVGFLAIPIPAGVGVREAVLVALLPGVGAAPLLAASLAGRLLSIAAELLAVFGNKLATRRYTRARCLTD